MAGVGTAPQVIWSAPGAPAVRAVAAQARRLQGADPLALVRVISPDAATTDGLRRSLPFAGGICGVEVSGTLRLARELADARSGPSAAERTATPVAVLAAVQHVLDSAQCPAELAECRGHPATHDALVRAWSSLNGAFTLGDRQGAAALRSLAAQRTSARAVVEVIVAVRRVLLARGWQDHAALLDQACAAAGATPQPPTVVVVTQQFNPAHVAFVRAVMASSPEAVIVAVDFGDGALSTAEHVARLAGVEAAALPTVQPELTVAASSPELTVLSCPDHDEEVREVARRVVRLLNSGTSADRIAVYYPAAGPHREVIAATLSGAGVAVRGQVRPALKGTVAGQILRNLLGALTPGQGLSRPIVLELARLAPYGPYTNAEGVLTTGWRDAARWTRNCRDLGIVGERDWDHWSTPPPETDAPDAGTPGERGPWRRTHLDGDLVGFVRGQRSRRARVRDAATWASLAGALGEWLAEHLGDDAWRQSHWKGYPHYQVEAAEQVEALVHNLTELDGIGVSLDVATAVRLLLAGLEDEVVTAESKGAGVYVAQIVAAPGGSFDHVFVVGANEGLLPGTVGDDLVLGAAHGPEPLGVLTGPANRPLRDHRGVIAAMAGAAESVTVTFARYEIRRGGELFPAPFVASLGVTASEIVSHAEQLAGAGEAWLSRAEWFAADPARTHPHLARRRRAITARLQLEPGEYDGHVGPLAGRGRADPFVRPPAGDDPGGLRPNGVTALENYGTCGMAFFVERVLGARQEDADAIELTDVDPREKGTIVHEVIDRLTRRWMAEHPDSVGVTPWIANEAELAQRTEAAEHELDDVAAEFLARRRLGHAEMWRARRAHLLAGIVAELRHDLDLGVMPVSSEYAFGDDGTVVWASPSGNLAFNGKIDRVNAVGGGLEVVDYKSGSPNPYKQIRADQPLGGQGTSLQLPLYGWAVEHGRPDQRVVRVAYRFIGQPTKDSEVALELSDAVRAAHREQIDAFVRGVREGRFLHGEVDGGLYPCAVCVPDGLGGDEVNQRRRVWAAEAQRRAVAVEARATGEDDDDSVS